MSRSIQGPPDPGRRDLLVRAAGAGLVIGTSGVLGWALHDPEGPGRAVTGPVVDLPDWRVPGDGPEVAVVTGRPRAEAVGRALAMLGGLERFVRPGDRVLVKPNAAFATPAALGATAHPETVGEIVRRSVALGALVTVTDTPIADPAGAFGVSGLEEAVLRAGGRLLVPRPSDFEAVTLRGARHVVDWPLLLEPLRSATRVIGVAPVKNHHRAGASLSLKNWYGLLGGARSVFHQDVHGLIRDLAVAVRPTLVVLDGTTSMVTNGPTGGSFHDLKPTGTMIVGTDPVAVDVLGLALLQLTLDDAPHVRLAAEAGAGRLDPEAVRVVVDRRG